MVLAPQVGVATHAGAKLWRLQGVGSIVGVEAHHPSLPHVREEETPPATVVRRTPDPNDTLLAGRCTLLPAATQPSHQQIHVPGHLGLFAPPDACQP